MLSGCLASCSVAFAYCVTSLTNGVLVEIVQTCVILHNMLVRPRMGSELNDEENEDGNLLRQGELVEEFYSNAVPDNVGEDLGEKLAAPFENSSLSCLETLLGVDKSMRNRQMHSNSRRRSLCIYMGACR